MRTIILVFILSVVITANSVAQNHFDALFKAPVNSITVKSKFDTEKPIMTKLIEKAAMDRIMIFMKQIELNDWQADQKGPNPEDYLFQISVNDRQDQIYLFSNAIFIGKTIYQIDKNVVKDFNDLYKAITAQ